MGSLNQTNVSTEHETLRQAIELLEKTGVEAIAGALPAEITDTDTLLLNLKALNARYDREDAIAHIRCLMTKYNIQLDQLI